MTEEIIKSIKSVETEAEKIKAEALAKATDLLSSTEKEIAQRERLAVENCKTYREERYKAALAEADEAYKKTLAEKEQEAKIYCENALKSSETYIGNIVGRIISGDC